jgi:hypothetical protein
MDGAIFVHPWFYSWMVVFARAESFPLASLALSGCLLYEYGVARDFVRGADLGLNWLLSLPVRNVDLPNTSGCLLTPE